jgi:hypothetical protein
MAILAIFTGTGITKQMYEDLRKDVQWEQNKPQGAVFHVASTDDSGNIHVADLWESKEQLNDFVNKRLVPAMQKRNITPPETEIFQVHNVNAFPDVDKYKLR